MTKNKNIKLNHDEKDQLSLVNQLDRLDILNHELINLFLSHY